MLAFKSENRLNVQLFRFPIVWFWARSHFHSFSNFVYFFFIIVGNWYDIGLFSSYKFIIYRFKWQAVIEHSAGTRGSKQASIFHFIFVLLKRNYAVGHTFDQTFVFFHFILFPTYWLWVHCMCYRNCCCRIV